jgi:hypothetical protein
VETEGRVSPQAKSTARRGFSTELSTGKLRRILACPCELPEESPRRSRTYYTYYCPYLFKKGRYIGCPIDGRSVGD